MIISASRRTDIPAFYAKWFIQRIKAGFCEVPNPFNPSIISKVSLLPSDVEVIVFWTRNPRPLFPHLKLLDSLGYRYIFLYTLIGNPKPLDPYSPVIPQAVRTFRQLSEQLGAQRVIWRYDPIILTPHTPIAYHIKQFETLCIQLHGFTQRVIISFVDVYRKAHKRLARLADQGFPIEAKAALAPETLQIIISSLVQLAESYGMQLFHCADQDLYVRYGGYPGKCIDTQQFLDIFGIQIHHTKDPFQREKCGCAISRDIGMYDTCIFGCQYCYANKDFELSRKNYSLHDPNFPSLVNQKVKTNSIHKQ